MWHGYERSRDDGASGQRVETTQDYKSQRKHRPQEPGLKPVRIWITSPLGNVVTPTVSPRLPSIIFLKTRDSQANGTIMRTGTRRRCTLITAASIPSLQIPSLLLPIPLHQARSLPLRTCLSTPPGNLQPTENPLPSSNLPLFVILGAIVIWDPAVIRYSMAVSAVIQPALRGACPFSSCRVQSQGKKTRSKPMLSQP